MYCLTRQKKRFSNRFNSVSYDFIGKQEEFHDIFVESKGKCLDLCNGRGMLPYIIRTVSRYVFLQEHKLPLVGISDSRV